MASTYTDAGIELIGVGEQSNTWGETTNTNWRLMEEMATGVVSISLNGTTSYNLTTTDGATSNGRHLVVRFTGSPGAAATVTVNPDDMQKVYFVDNSTDERITLTQGSGGDVTVPAGTKKIVYCDGEGSGAKVTDLTENLAVSPLNVGSTWSVREDSGVLYFESTGGGSVEVAANGDMTVSGKIFASGEIVVE